MTTYYRASVNSMLEMGDCAADKYTVENIYLAWRGINSATGDKERSIWRIEVAEEDIFDATGDEWRDRLAAIGVYVQSYCNAADEALYDNIAPGCSFLVDSIDADIKWIRFDDSLGHETIVYCGPDRIEMEAEA